MSEHTPISAATLQAVGELLAAAEQYGLGLAFEPDPDGWRVNYIISDWPAYQDFQMAGGELANAYSLDVAAAASLKPLVEMGERSSAYFAKRDAEKG
ncbi:hypothetical protein [Terrabacter sp. Root181]|uniref:hypothetical protein n=1 Tax=Terrabacter sp. Root181 TaxID=1736484 RepID=UPI0012F92BE7|nr:hypothetical protein [Terrabacter sp. Root181]